MCFRIAHNRAIRRVGSSASDSSESQGFGIGPVGVPIIALEKDGAIGEGFVEIFFVGQSFGAEHGVIPAASQHPILARMFGGIITQSLLDIGSVLCTFEGHATEAEGAVEEMDVALG